MKTYLVHYKEWADPIHWALDGGWITKSKVVKVNDPIELNDMFQNIESINIIY
jgi:hypothetical protein